MIVDPVQYTIRKWWVLPMVTKEVGDHNEEQSEATLSTELGDSIDEQTEELSAASEVSKSIADFLQDGKLGSTSEKPALVLTWKFRRRSNSSSLPTNTGRG